MTALTEYGVLAYALRVYLFLGLFYGCYWLLLRRHTFLHLNRVYLLATLVASLWLPFVQIPGLHLRWLWSTDASPTPLVTAEAGYAIAPADVPDAPLLPDWPDLALWTYLLVAAGLLLRTTWQMARLLRRIRRWPAQAGPDYTLITPTDAQTPTFSFFRYLVLNPADAQSEAIKQHELVHIRQGHSWDVLFVEAMQALCWLNPVLIGYRRALRRTHEYLADYYATTQLTTARDEYARFLVNYAFNLPDAGWPDGAVNDLTHPFQAEPMHSPTLKQRIQMLYQPRTQPRALWTYALALPFAVALLALNTPPANELPAQAMSRPLQEKIVSVQGLVLDKKQQPLSGANIVIKNSTRGTTADAKGRFSIDAPEDVTLVASFVGFESSEMTVPKAPEPGNYILLVFKLKQLAVDGSVATNVPASPQPPEMARSADGKEIYSVVEENPAYPGGFSALFKYINSNLRYPDEARQQRVQGKVFVTFVIKSDGTVSDATVLKGIGYGCDEEALRLVGTMPKWKPGKQNGIPVAVRYNLPISFQPADQFEPSERTQGAAPAGGNQLTQPRPAQQSGVSKGITDQPPLYLLNGKEITKEEMEKIDPKTIEQINVMKGDQSGLYGAKAKYGVVDIKLKAK